MKKRSTSILLAALIIFSLLPTNLMTAFAMTDVLTSKKAAQIPFTVLWENQTHTPSDFEGSVCVFVYGDVTCPSTADAVA